MRPLSVAHIAIASLGVTVAACGFSGVGGVLDGEDAGTAASGGPARLPPGADGGPSAEGSTPVPICNPPPCALPAPPAGWELVLMASTRADACPSGFDSADAVESPVATASACACAACVTTGTNCATGAIPTAYDNGGGACGTTGAVHQTNGGACKNQNGSFGQDARVDAPTAVLGTCTSAASGVPANVVSEARRVCTLQASSCGDRACGAPGSMQACVASPGDVACPAGTPNKHLVGADVALACPPCGCTIASATCGGSLEFYPQQNCAGSPVSLAVGVCKATGGASFQSTKWKPLVAAEVCAVVPGTPTTTLTAARTVCCP
jgi:hypothetical protein